MCVGLLMYSAASVCEIYADDINMGVGPNVCVLVGFVVLVRQDPGSVGVRVWGSLFRMVS
jgi:hypothetical protein